MAQSFWGPSEAEVMEARHYVQTLGAGLSPGDARLLERCRTEAEARLAASSRPTVTAIELIDGQLLHPGRAHRVLDPVTGVASAHQQVLRAAGVTAEIVNRLDPDQLGLVFDQHASVLASRPGAVLRHAAARQTANAAVAEHLRGDRRLFVSLDNPGVLEDMLVSRALAGYALVPDQRRYPSGRVEVGFRQIHTMTFANVGPSSHDVVLVEAAEPGRLRAEEMVRAARVGSRVWCVSCDAAGGQTAFDGALVAQEMVAARLANPGAERHSLIAAGAQDGRGCVEMVAAMPRRWRPDQLAIVLRWNGDRNAFGALPERTAVPVTVHVQPHRPPPGRDWELLGLDPRTVQAEWSKARWRTVDLDSLYMRRRRPWTARPAAPESGGPGNRWAPGTPPGWPDAQRPHRTRPDRRGPDTPPGKGPGS